MYTPKLIKHGDYIVPMYRAVIECVHAATLNSALTAEFNATVDGTQTHGLAARYNKDAPASATANIQNLVNQSNDRAIRFNPQPKVGGEIIFAIAFVLFSIFTGITFVFPYSVFTPATVFAGFWCLCEAIRYRQAGPSSFPIIFDRAKRKIYIMTLDSSLGVFFKHRLMVCAYDWDAVHVECHQERELEGDAFIAHYRLVFVISKSSTDPTIIRTFDLALENDNRKEAADEAWEFIRRFMQEKESLNTLTLPKKQLNQSSTMSQWFTRQVAWPQEVVESVGQRLASPITRKTLANDKE